MTTYLAKLVGNHFRESGRLILPVLSEGTALILEPEPDNPHDPDAIKVCVDLFGHEFNKDPTKHLVIHLGYIPRSRNNNFGTLEVLNIIRQPNWTAELTFDMAGMPLVRIDTLPSVEQSN